MDKLNPILKNILQESIFGALFALWTAPIDGPKLKLPAEKTIKKGNFFSKDLIIGFR